jgi:hypothetical protein
MNEQDEVAVMDRSFNQLSHRDKRLEGYVDGTRYEHMTERVHVAGATDSDGAQHCLRCGIVISIPPAPAFKTGAHVKMLDSKPEGAWRTGDRPSCYKPREAA